jgi:endogenous inhibitor of DNA gyrase (YacG/DUF329 family)
VPEEAENVVADAVSGRGGDGHPGVVIANCARCGRPFVRHRRGHLYCSRRCRHRGVLGRTAIVDHEAVARLFDESRDPHEQVRADDWHPGPPEWVEIHLVETVAARRRWFKALEDDGSSEVRPRRRAPRAAVRAPR